MTLNKKEEERSKKRELVGDAAKAGIQPKPLARHQTIAFLEEMTQAEKEALALELQVAHWSVRDCTAAAVDWIHANGKTYKDYRAFIRGWIRRDVERGRVLKIELEPEQRNALGFTLDQMMALSEGRIPE